MRLFIYIIVSLFSFLAVSINAAGNDPSTDNSTAQIPAPAEPKQVVVIMPDHLAPPRLQIDPKFPDADKYKINVSPGVEGVLMGTPPQAK
jgi:hypothetical protein